MTLTGPGRTVDSRAPRFAWERLLSETQQHPGAMVLLMDLQGHYIYVNDACRELLEYEPEEVIGRHATDFAAAEDVPHVAVTMQDALLNDESVTVKIRVKAKSGELKPVRGAAFRLEDPDTGEAFMGGWVEPI